MGTLNGDAGVAPSKPKRGIAITQTGSVGAACTAASFVNTRAVSETIKASCARSISLRAGSGHIARSACARGDLRGAYARGLVEYARRWVRDARRAVGEQERHGSGRE
jgi:hypothetical protein